METNASRDLNEVIVSGFGRIQRDIAAPSPLTSTLSNNDTSLLYWFCEPKDSGSWALSNNLSVLTIVPPRKQDFWRRTHYDPTIVKDDGPFLYVKLPYDPTLSNDSHHYIVESEFTLRAVRQFDQAGIMIRLSYEHWLKTGIEVVDKQPRLSCVVTNVYSDWSAQPWLSSAQDANVFNTPQENTEQGTPLASMATPVVIAHCHLRVHVRDETFVVEVKAHSGSWEFVRIAFISKRMVDLARRKQEGVEVNASSHGPDPASGQLWAGVFACSPEEQQGGSATFSNFRITKGSSFDHQAI
ncbi:hypothetical protein MPSEU_000249400 [Mayamaea pseudoterrestris]|nr:hypothetical protein MPSEU_000249400 [Mayamaea pseudoterrestris]